MLQIYSNINDRRLLALSIMLFIPILIDFAAAFLGNPNSTVTMLIYGLSFLYFIIYSIKHVKYKNLIIIASFYLVCVLNILIFYDSIKYMQDLAFVLVCFYYFPLSVLIIYNISDWSRFFIIIRPIAIISIILGVYIVSIQGINLFARDSIFSYMEFSYAIAPMIVALYVNARENRRVIDYILSVIGLITVLIYGARAALGFMVIFIILFELFVRKIKVSTRIMICVLALILYINLENIATMLSSYEMFSNSRTLLRFLNNELLETDGRDYIYISCQQRISTMGLDISGLFGDRFYCAGIYPHNIIYEILMSYGVIIGTIILLILFGLICYNIFKYNNNVVLTLFFVFTLFARFFISGSYIIEGKFWIFLFALLSITRNNRQYNPRVKTN